MYKAKKTERSNQGAWSTYPVLALWLMNALIGEGVCFILQGWLPDCQVSSREQVIRMSRNPKWGRSNAHHRLTDREKLGEPVLETGSMSYFWLYWLHCQLWIMLCWTTRSSTYSIVQYIINYNAFWVEVFLLANSVCLPCLCAYNSHIYYIYILLGHLGTTKLLTPAGYILWISKLWLERCHPVWNN